MCSIGVEQGEHCSSDAPCAPFLNCAPALEVCVPKGAPYCNGNGAISMRVRVLLPIFRVCVFSQTRRPFVPGDGCEPDAVCSERLGDPARCRSVYGMAGEACVYGYGGKEPGVAMCAPRYHLR